MSRRRRSPSRLWSLDLETTGLDVERAEMLAVGMVPVVDDVIVVGEAFASYVSTEGAGTVATPAPAGGPATTRSATLQPAAGLAGMEAHHLRPRDVAGAPSLHVTMSAILARLGDGDALLVHHAPLDVAVLRRSCARIGERWPRITVVDTVRAIQRANRRRSVIGAPQLPTDLAGARRALGLPPHAAHDALADAIATAELHLALRAAGR